MIYFQLGIIAILLIALLHSVYKIYTLKKAIKDFSPVKYVEQTNVTQIGVIKPFTDEQDMNLSQFKEVLNLVLSKLDYRIATYTQIQNTCYRPKGNMGDTVLYELKSDSEKWMETGRMNGYLDIR